MARKQRTADRRFMRRLVRFPNYPTTMNPTEEEMKAIESLKRLAKKWPKSLWLYSANATLNVMRKGDDGEHVILPHGGVDPDYSLATVNIENDGGDW